MRALFAVAVLVLVGCGGASGHDVRTEDGGGEAGSVEPAGGDRGGQVAQGGADQPAGGAAGAGGATPDGGASPGGAETETGGAVESGGSVTGGAVTGGVSTGGSVDGGAATGGTIATGGSTGGSGTGGAEAGPCTWVCVTDTRYYSYPGSNSHQVRSYSYEECPSGAPETTSCAQGAGYSVAVSCSNDGEPATDCEPWPDGGTGGSAGTGGTSAGGSATGGSSPIDSGTWVLDGTCVRLVYAVVQVTSEEFGGSCLTTDPGPCYVYNPNPHPQDHSCSAGACVACDARTLNCDGRDTTRCEVDWFSLEHYSDTPDCATVLADTATWATCVNGYWGIDPSGTPCGDTCFACVPVCSD